MADYTKGRQKTLPLRRKEKYSPPRVSILSFGNQSKAYEITTLSVGLFFELVCSSLITFEPVGRFL
jgi:hypothetical protein